MRFAPPSSPSPASDLLFAVDPGHTSDLPGMPIINLGFCNADDHLLVGIGDHRQGVFVSYFGFQGLFARVELWATEREVLSMIDAAIEGRSRGAGVCIEVVANGSHGQLIVEALRESEEFARAIKLQILRLLRKFRANPAALQQASFWKMARDGSADISEIELVTVDETTLLG